MDDHNEFFDELDDSTYHIPLEDLLRSNLRVVLDKGIQFRTTCPNEENHSGGKDNKPSFFIWKAELNGFCQMCKFNVPNIYEYYGERPGKMDNSILLDKVLKGKTDVALELPEDAILDIRYPVSRGISKYALFGETFFISESLDEENKDGTLRSYIAYKDLTDKIRWIEGRKVFDDDEKVPKIKSLIGSKKFIYPANVTLDDNTVIVVEGIYDLLMLRENGIYNAVMAGGTGAKAKDVLDIPHLRRILLVYDGDKGGQDSATALERKLNYWLRGHDVNILVENIVIPAGKDPGSMTKEEIDTCIRNYL